MQAAGVNRPDVLQRQGGYAPPPGASDLPGLEVAGRVVANRFTADWLGRREQLRDEVAAEEARFAWTAKNNSTPDTMLNWAGESAGLVHEVLPAADVVNRTVEQAEQLLRAVTGIYGNAPAPA